MTQTALRFDDRGLVPVVAQDRATGRVLMVAYMHEEALARTRQTGFAWYWSRSRGRLWKKGEESGHVQRVREIRQDCDGDTLLLLVDQEGPACHTGNPSCFFRDPDGAPQPEALPPAAVLGELEAVLKSRRATPRPGSYTSRLFAEGTDAIGAKVTEEAEEVVRAAKGEGHRRVVEEAADVIFHLMTLLVHQGVGFDEVCEELKRRRR